MPVWSNDVPQDPRGPAFQLKRTPAGKPIVALITSDDLIGCFTHFWGGHTVPCEGQACEACHNNIPYRWHGYLSAIDTTTRQHFIFEMTAQAADAFKDFRKANGTLRGCLFEARRLRPAANSRVCIRCKPADLREQHLPTAPDLRKCMAIIWGIPDTDAEINGLAKDVGRIAVDRSPDVLNIGNGDRARQPKPA